jgi:hypothetical protein
MAVPKVDKAPQSNPRHPTTGAALVKVKSPAAGVANQQGDGNAALPAPASVLGTGINADLYVQGAEA